MKIFKLSPRLEDEVEGSSVKSPWGTSLDILHSAGGGGQERNRMLAMLRYM